MQAGHRRRRPAALDRNRCIRSVAGVRVQLEGRLVARKAAKAELQDRCTVEVYRRSDAGPCKRMELSLRMLEQGGCSRALWGDEEERDDLVDVANWELDESRQLLYRHELQWHQGMQIKIKPWH